MTKDNIYESIYTKAYRLETELEERDAMLSEALDHIEKLLHFCKACGGVSLTAPKEFLERFTGKYLD